ncbi:MAG: uroporphyrinogen-III synthase [Arenimonas sp.]
MQGWYVISLRPLGQHDALRRQAAKFGASSFALSTLRLQARRGGEDLGAALRCPRVVFTSPAAVRFAQAQRPLRARAGQLWFAPGAGTAAALRRAGIERVEHPARGAGAEWLLADPRLQSLQGARVGIVTAPGGRELLLETLRGRGAVLHLAPVYQRTPMQPTPARLRALDALPARSALLLSSGEALRSLWQSLDASGRARLCRRPCVASSERLATQARALGFAAPLRAEDARPASLLAALAAHAADARIR